MCEGRNRLGLMKRWLSDGVEKGTCEIEDSVGSYSDVKVRGTK